MWPGPGEGPEKSGLEVGEVVWEWPWWAGRGAWPEVGCGWVPDGCDRGWWGPLGEEGPLGRTEAPGAGQHGSQAGQEPWVRRGPYTGGERGEAVAVDRPQGGLQRGQLYPPLPLRRREAAPGWVVCG